MSEHSLILDRLRRLAAEDRRPKAAMADRDAAASLFSFVTHQRERIAGAAFSRLSIVIIVEGSKLMIGMGRQQRFGAGTILILPPGWRGDVVNDPDPHTGAYRAIFIDFPDHLVRVAEQRFAPARHPLRLDLPLDSMAADAIRHAGDGIADGSLPKALLEHRVLEILLVLGQRGALPARCGSTTEAVRALVRWQPERAWTAEMIAAEIGTSNATLRRRLALEGTSLRPTLAAERVALADALLKQDGVSMREAAMAAGYRSPRRFAHRFHSMQENAAEIPEG